MSAPLLILGIIAVHQMNEQASSAPTKEHERSHAYDAAEKNGENESADPHDGEKADGDASKAEGEYAEPIERIGNMIHLSLQ